MSEADVFKIYVDRLRGGKEQHFDESLDPSFLEIDESDLKFDKDVQLKGNAYIAEDELILHWDIKAEAIIPCSICNQPVPVEIEIENCYQSIPLEEIRTGVFDFKECLRETILVEVPPFAECNGGHCPKREELKSFFKKTDGQGNQDEGYQPFANFDWK